MLSFGLLGLVVLGLSTNISDYFQVAELRQIVRNFGAWGPVIYVGMFMLGGLLHVPGIVMVTAGAIAFGGLEGLWTAIVGAVACVISSFLIVRAIGGKPLQSLSRPRFARTLLEKFDAHPIRTIIVLRTFLMVSPPLNYALALTKVSTKDFVIGSVLGLLIPVSVVVGLSEFIVSWQV